MSEAAAPPSRILYIDDDAALCALVRRSLGRRGFEVVAETDARAGVERAAAEAFDALGIDHYMPRQDGLATLEQLRARGVDAPIVYVTGSDESRIAVAALKAGASDYVIKTGAEDYLDLLCRAFEQAVEQVRLQRQKDVAERALRDANARLEAVVERQAVLLREVNHRVANSLQLVQSLVHMQTSTVQDKAARAALRDTGNRVSAIMQVHKRLYTGDDVRSVDAEAYLGGLVEELRRSLAQSGDRREIRFHSDELQLATDQAISLGVIVTELVTNACKYAYGGDETGEVRVRLDRDGAELRLVVEDDGCGLPPDGHTRGTGLGRRVVDAMASSLKSRLHLDPAHSGVRAVVTFAVQPPEATNDSLR